MPARAGTGSGVIYTADGYILTNNHVVEFADEFDITLHDNREFKARLVGADPSTDMAVLKIDANPTCPPSNWATPTTSESANGCWPWATRST